MRMKVNHISPLIFVILLIIGCASMGPPGGGPEDKAPPEILHASPEAGSVLVDPTTDITIEFNESIREESLKQAFSLSPPPPGKVTAKWKSKSVTLSFDPQLAKDRTYVFTLGTTLSDKRNNTLKQSFHLPFSTGEQLDQAKLTGQLVDANGSVQGWNIVAYLLDTTAPSTNTANDSSAAPFADSHSSSDSLMIKERTDPDPAFDLPDAATQTGEDGAWELSHLREGQWRVFAFQDGNGDRLWTKTTEAIAVPSRDMLASADSSKQLEHLVLYGASHDMLPNLREVVARYRDMLLVRFDRKPPSLNIEIKTTDIHSNSEDSLLSGTVQPIKVSEFNYDPADSSILRVWLKEKTSGDSLRIWFKGSMGLRSVLDTSTTISLKNPLEVDSLKPAFLRVNPPDNSILHREARELTFIFDEEMAPTKKPAFFFGLAPVDTTPDTLVATLETPFTFRVELKKNVSPGSYILTMIGENLTDRAGNTLADSIKSFKYRYLSDDSLGTVSGEVEGLVTRDPVVLKLKPLSPNHQPLEKRLVRPGKFKFSSVPQGVWQLEGWLDRNHDGIFTRGNPSPFDPADPYTLSTDSIFIRARWESGDEVLIFK
ncbi:Ig-like domain-containing protein [bacterium]|nr:Ig-like domain-containing protein [bacterium]